MKINHILHLYQPDFQSREVLKQVLEESYLPIIDLLRTYPEYKVTLNITGSTFQIYNKYDVANLAELFMPFYKSGQVVFSSTSFSHLILPFATDTQFDRQVKLNNEKLSEFMDADTKPEIFFFPELFVDLKSLRKIKEMGFKAACVSENSLSSLVPMPDIVKLENLGLNLIIRSTKASRGFENPDISNYDQLSEYLGDEDRVYNVVHDGEILGHRFKEKILFMKNLLDSKQVTFVHFDESSAEIAAISEEQFDTASWERIEYNGEKIDPHWRNPHNEIHKFQWELTNLVVLKIEELDQKGIDVKRFQSQIDYIQYSCQYWWASSLPFWNTGFVVYAAWKWLRLAYEMENILKEQELTTFVTEVNSSFSRLLAKIAEYDATGWMFKNMNYFDKNILPLRSKGLI